MAAINSYGVGEYNLVLGDSVAVAAELIPDPMQPYLHCHESHPAQGMQLLQKSLQYLAHPSTSCFPGCFIL